MANTLYDSARQQFLEGKIDWMNDTVKVILVSNSYNLQAGVHQYLSDVGTSSRVAGPVLLGSKTTNGGAADAADITFSAVSGSTVTGIIIYVDKGAENASPLLVYLDTATGLPITPNGGDIIITWDSGTNRIFRV